MIEKFDDLGKRIMKQMSEMAGVRVYVSLVDNNGNFLVSDSTFDKHRDFIKSFTINNFAYLNEGDHSIPLSSENIVFFKCTKNFMVVLYNPKGKIGQLMSFHSIMPKYIDSIKQYELTFLKTTYQKIDEELVTITIPAEQLEFTLLSHKKESYRQIIPYFNQKNLKNKKFTIDETRILQKCDGNNNLLQMTETLDINESEILNILYKFYSKKHLTIPDHYFLKIQCQDCKNSIELFVPELLLNKNTEKIRVQLFPEECNHTFLAIIDKNLKVETHPIEKLIGYRDTVDLNNLTIARLISFLGQDLFFNIFHALFFQIPIAILEKERVVNLITQFMKKIFNQIEYGNQIISIDEAELKKNFKKYKNHLVISLDSNIVIESYEKLEFFDFEQKLFKKISNLKDENLQILAAYGEFERLTFLLDTIIEVLNPLEKITEEDLIKEMETNQCLIIKRYEIPIIKKLAEMYYDVDLSKKIVKTMMGHFDDFFH